MHTAKVTPKDFFLWTGAMITLYVSVVSLITLLFDYIDIAFPDTLNSYAYYDPYSGSIRFAIASLIVLFPTCLIIMRFIRQDIHKDHSKADLWVRRWAIVFTLFGAVVTAVVDLITLINTFLGGEMTTHFVLKVVVVFLIASGVFMHYLADLRGYWNSNPKYVREVNISVCILVLATVISGFFIIGSPNQARLYRFDDQKISDLQGIQSQVIAYWQHKDKLPTQLKDLSDSINGITIPVDAQTSAPYIYSVVGPLTFELCATFNTVTQSDSPDLSQPTIPTASNGTIHQSDSWVHPSGYTCFVRTIDPQLYQPVTGATKTTPVVQVKA